jgi:RNA polymerase sigma-70 factor, ECF subfamily
MLLADEQLMLESCRGSVPAFELLVQRWDKRMLNFFIRCTGNREQAEDLRQELFLRVFTQKNFKGDGNFQSWLYRIATNLVIDKVVRKKNPETVSRDEEEQSWISDMEASGDSSREQARQSELERKIQAALNRLPNEQRISLVMRHFDNLSFKEIAETLGFSESTVKTQVYRGLSRLCEELKRMGILELDCLQTV